MTKRISRLTSGLLLALPLCMTAAGAFERPTAVAFYGADANTSAHPGPAGEPLAAATANGGAAIDRDRRV